MDKEEKKPQFETKVYSNTNELDRYLSGIEGEFETVGFGTFKGQSTVTIKRK